LSSGKLGIRGRLGAFLNHDRTEESDHAGAKFIMGD
jgi:hypothetical protein